MTRRYTIISWKGSELRAVLYVDGKARFPLAADTLRRLIQEGEDSNRDRSFEKAALADLEKGLAGRDVTWT